MARAFAIVLLCALAQILCACGVWAEETKPSTPARAIRLENLSVDDVLAVAARLVQAGRYDDALTILNRLATDGTGGVERDFLEGMIALARKDLSRAETIFRKILADAPKLLRVRLELAQTLYLERKDEEADYHFRLAAAERPPEAVTRNIARFREAIRARRAWRFNVTFAFAPDTNINAATDKERVEILGLPFKLNPSGRAHSGTGLIAGMDASLRLWRDRKVPLYLGVYGRVVRYGDSHFDDIYVGGEAGPEFGLTGGRLRVAATMFERWYGGQSLVTSPGGRLNFDKVIGGKWGIETSFAVRHNDYARRTDLDGWDIQASFLANRALSASVLGFAYALVQRSIAHDPGQSNWQGTLGFGAIKEIRCSLRPQLSLEVGRQVHDTQLTLFGKTRRDWRLQVTASIYKRDWNFMGFAPSLRVTWLRNFSTISLYDQKRLRAEFAMTKAF